MKPPQLTEWNALLTRSLHFIDVLQKVLPLVDDIEGQVVHGQSFVCMVLEALFCYREIFRVKVVHLLRKLIVPRLKVWDDLTQESIFLGQDLKISICCDMSLCQVGKEGTNVTMS